MDYKNDLPTYNTSVIAGAIDVDSTAYALFNKDHEGAKELWQTSLARTLDFTLE